METEILTGNLKDHSYFESQEGQREVGTLIDQLKGEVGNPKGYLEICKKADQSEGKLTSETLEALFEKFNGLIKNTPPGHDINHIYRDALAGLAFASNDRFVKNSFSQADIQAGILGSIFHDIGNAVARRYLDNKHINAHAEIGAYIFWQTSEGVINENVRKLATYAIAAHTHYLKPISIKEPQGYERQPYWYEIFYPEEGKPCGLAPIITRFSDRLEANGGAFVARTMSANADALELGGGSEFGGDKGFFEINKESLVTLFYPQIREEKPKPSSALEHALMFAKSNFGNSVYSQNDHLFPLMGELMKAKTDQTYKLIEIVSIPPEMMDFSNLKAEAVAKNTMRQISGSKNFDRAWKNLLLAWQEIDPETQARWENGFRYIQKSYIDWLEILQSKIGDEYQEFADGLVHKCI